jgi:hypothetical protein
MFNRAARRPFQDRRRLWPVARLSWGPVWTRSVAFQWHLGATCVASSGPALCQGPGRLDPGLEDRDFADAGTQLDRMHYGLFTCYGLSPEDVTRLRRQFAAWPRS